MPPLAPRAEPSDRSRSGPTTSPAAVVSAPADASSTRAAKRARSPG